MSPADALAARQRRMLCGQGVAPRDDVLERRDRACASGARAAPAGPRPASSRPGEASMPSRVIAAESNARSSSSRLDARRAARGRARSAGRSPPARSPASTRRRAPASTDLVGFVELARSSPRRAAGCVSALRSTCRGRRQLLVFAGLAAPPAQLPELEFDELQTRGALAAVHPQAVELLAQTRGRRPNARATCCCARRRVRPRRRAAGDAARDRAVADARAGRAARRVGSTAP